jgi:CRISPR-associated endonuclease Cas2
MTTSRSRYLVTYDVADDKRRDRVHRTLLDFGDALQFSVFLCDLNERERIGKSLSPILLVRDSNNGKVVIADGYHRLCAVYSMGEDELIPCKSV